MPAEIHFLNYTEYRSMGGTLDNSAFTSLLFKAESKVNKRTFGKARKLEVYPPELKYLVFGIINLLEKNTIDRDINVSSYNNGIESFSYNTDYKSLDSAIDSQVNNMILEYLSPYPNLLYRGVRNDLE